jgi:imidazolonepropionase
MDGDASRSAADTVAVTDGRIAAVGVKPDSPAVDTVDAGGKVMLPGFIDCHTHLLHAGHRMEEHSLKLQGAAYAELARAGGGILSTVKAVREAGEDRLVLESSPRLQALLREGVTTVEAKSGYGLDTANELKMLSAIRQLGRYSPVSLSATFLGAHAVPKGSQRSDYLDEVVNEMLPRVVEEKLADTVDIYVEHIAFDVADMERLFAAAKDAGLKVRAHTDQLSNLGATRRAAELGALSCDHLEYTEPADVEAMREHGTVAVLLPGAFYFLRETRLPPVEAFREAGVPMAVSTDINPGSSPVVSLHTVMHMAATLFRLTPEEVLLGVTANAARAMGLDDRGRIVPGMRADFCLWDIPAPEFLVYQLGGLRPERIFIGGHAA